MELDKIPQWLLALEPEDIAFLKNFVLKSGSLKEIARLYGVSYPTVRLRLDKLMQKIELSDQQKEAPFSAFIKGLAVDGRVDLDTAKLIIDRYQREKEADAGIRCLPWPPPRQLPCSTSGPPGEGPGTGIWAALSPPCGLPS